MRWGTWLPTGLLCAAVLAAGCARGSREGSGSPPGSTSTLRTETRARRVVVQGLPEGVELPGALLGGTPPLGLELRPDVQDEWGSAPPRRRGEPR